MIVRSTPGARSVRWVTMLGTVAVLAGTLFGATPSAAHGHYGHGPHARAGLALHVGSAHGGHHSRHRGYSGVSLFYSAPLYVSPPPPAVVAVAPVVVQHSSRAPRALPRMPVLHYVPMRGQDDARLTLDRQTCERSAWRATRPRSGARVVEVSRSVRRVPVHAGAATPVPRTAGGALLGAVGGAIAGDAGLGAAIGAAVGATSWLLDAASAPVSYYQQEVIHREYRPAPGPDPVALRATLMACMEGRGYEVR